jgi:hypothetical protein
MGSGPTTPSKKARRHHGDHKTDKTMNKPKDACYNKVMQSYGKWSARAAQAVAKCRKASGDVRKTEAGANLKRWEKEKWVDTKTGKACGAGGSNEYCRPTKRVSSKTPVTKKEMSPSKLAAKKAEKSVVGMGRKVKPVKRK